MRNRFIVPSLILAYGLLAVIGCHPISSTSRPIEPPLRPPEIETPASTADRMADLTKRLDEFDAQSTALPGATETAQREAMSRIFTTLPILLKDIADPAADGAFRQQLDVIQSSREELQVLSPQLSSEPTIATGLRTAANALNVLDARLFVDHPDILQPLGVLKSKLQELDAVHGLRHRQVVAENVTVIRNILRQMHDAMAQQPATTLP